MSFLTGIVGRFVSKRIGSKMGGSMFNHSVTSCDGYDVCGPCCFDGKEAKQKNMYVCGSQQCKTSPLNSQTSKNLGGIDTCQTIELINDLVNVPSVSLDQKTNRLLLMNGKGQPLVNEFSSFNLDYFFTALMLTLGGNNLEMTISLNPIDHYDMKCTTKPEFIVRERLVGDLLFVCDWILKCLGFGCFIDETTGVNSPFDNDIQKQLNAIDYKSILQLRNEMPKTFSECVAVNWIEPEYINVNIMDDVMYPAIGMRCFSKADSQGEQWGPLFATWFTKNFEQITKIFPIFNDLRELIVTLTIVKVLRYYELDFYQLELMAVKHLDMGKYLKPNFKDDIYKFHVFEIAPNNFISGGIVNNYSINRHNDQEKIIHIKMIPGKSLEVDPKFKNVLTVLSELRLMLGSKIRIDSKAKIGDLILKFAIMSKLDPSWIEFYKVDDTTNKLNETDPITDTEIRMKVNITSTDSTNFRIMINGGTLII